METEQKDTKNPFDFILKGFKAKNKPKGVMIKVMTNAKELEGKRKEKPSSRIGLDSKWKHIIEEGTSALEDKQDQIKEMVKLGVPVSMRNIVWPFLSQTSTNKAKGKYQKYLQQTSEWERIISLDIPRTYPQHEFFQGSESQGQKRLFNVLKAYSLHEPSVGYCQGLNFIVGVLVLYLNEEDAFLVLLHLMENREIRFLFKNDLPGLHHCRTHLTNFVKVQIPDLYRHFEKEDMDVASYADPWFLTLFTKKLPLNLATRVLDLVLLEGMNVIYCLSIAILMCRKKLLLRMNMEEMVEYFQDKLPYKNDSHLDFLVAIAFERIVKKNQK